MRIVNTITGTEPLFLHAQGRSHFTREWVNLISDVIPKQTSDVIFPALEKITLVTFIYGNMPTALDRQLKKAGIPFVNLAKYFNHDGAWRNSFKIKYLYEYLYIVKTEYVLCLDSIDVLICNDLSGLVEKFETLNCDILYGASVNSHPVSIKIVEDENSKWKYLNCGTILGRTEPLKEFYKVLEGKVSNSSGGHCINNEQGIIRPIRPFYSNVKSDTNCEIFQTLGGSRYTYENQKLTIF